MATLVFDIETVGEDWSLLDTVTKESLSRWIERTVRTPEEKAAKLTDLKAGLGFSPFTGSIVAISLYDVERGQGAAYFISDREEEYEEDNFVLRSLSEKRMLELFWEGARSYDTFVTFNGRGFDVPFLMVRSAIHDIRPTRDLMEGRYLYQQKRTRHVDLQDQLSWYGAMMRRPSLHMVTRAFGIESPKAEGISGDDVAELFKAKKFRDIASYNIRDVRATTLLYEKWLLLLAPASFTESLDIV